MAEETAPETGQDENDLLRQPTEATNPPPEEPPPAEPEKDEAEAEIPPPPAPVTPETAPPTAAAPAPQPATAPTQADDTSEQEYAQWQREVDAVNERMKKGQFDPLAQDDATTIARLQMQGMQLQQRRIDRIDQRTVLQQQAQAADQSWRTWGAGNPEIPVSKAQEVWNEELTKAQTRFGNSAAAQGAATVAWENRIAILKGQAKKPAPTPQPRVPAPTVTKGGAAVAPKSTRPPPPKPKTLDDEIEQSFTSDKLSAICD
jgi:hypothetical protein